MTHSTPAPLPTERRAAHALAVEAREALGMATRALHGSDVRTARDWLRLVERARRARAAAVELEEVAANAYRILLAHEAGGS